MAILISMPYTKEIRVGLRPTLISSICLPICRYLINIGIIVTNIDITTNSIPIGKYNQIAYNRLHEDLHGYK